MSTLNWQPRERLNSWQNPLDAEDNDGPRAQPVDADEVLESQEEDKSQVPEVAEADSAQPPPPSSAVAERILRIQKLWEARQQGEQAEEGSVEATQPQLKKMPTVGVRMVDLGGASSEATSARFRAVDGFERRGSTRRARSKMIDTPFVPPPPPSQTARSAQAAAGQRPASRRAPPGLHPPPRRDATTPSGAKVRDGSTWLLFRTPEPAPDTARLTTVIRRVGKIRSALRTAVATPPAHAAAAAAAQPPAAANLRGGGEASWTASPPKGRGIGMDSDFSPGGGTARGPGPPAGEMNRRASAAAAAAAAGSAAAAAGSAAAAGGGPDSTEAELAAARAGAAAMVGGGEPAGAAAAQEGPAGGAPIRVGAMLLVHSRGRWRLGSVVRVHGHRDRVRVSFVNEGPQFDEWVMLQSDRVSLLERPPGRAQAVGDGLDILHLLIYGDPPPPPPAAPQPQHPSLPPLKPPNLNLPVKLSFGGDWAGGATAADSEAPGGPGPGGGGGGGVGGSQAGLSSRRWVQPRRAGGGAAGAGPGVTVPGP